MTDAEREASDEELSLMVITLMNKYGLSALVIDTAQFRTRVLTRGGDDVHKQYTVREDCEGGSYLYTEAEEEWTITT